MKTDRIDNPIMIDEILSGESRDPGAWVFGPDKPDPAYLPDCPGKMPLSARLVAETSSSWSPWYSNEDKFFLSTNRSHSHWILWYAFFDDNDCVWINRPFAACLKKGVPPKSAAAWLVKDVWENFRWSYETPKPQNIYAGCMLSEEELEAIAAHVWPGEEEDREEEDL